MSPPRCSLIVPVHNGLEYLAPMLDSLKACTPDGAYELILSDDASDEPTVSFLKGLQAPIQTLFSESNNGFAAACNAGAKVAQGNYLIFLNTDLGFRSGWLEALTRAADGDKAIGAVGCKLLYPDGAIQHGGVFLREDQLDRIPLIASHDHVGKPGDDPEANQRAEMLAVTAAAILVRREAFEAVGGFDEGYFNGYEDVDLCLKLGEQGWRILYEPACCLIHHESKSGVKRFVKSKSNQRRFVERWQGRVRPEVLVSPYMDVSPHPSWKPDEAFTPYRTELEGSVRLVVPIEGNVAAAAQTLESIFAARIGLYDLVVAVAPGHDKDAHRYLNLCGGYDDSFRVAEGTWYEAASNTEQDFVAVLEPGTIVTQGWLSRMLRRLNHPDINAVGPMLDGIGGPQNAMFCIPPGQSGNLFPNELSHAFAAAYRGTRTSVESLHPSCFIIRSGALKQKSIEQILNGKNLVVAKDVFVHRDARFFPAKNVRFAA